MLSGSGRAGRTDEATYAEALQTVDEHQALVGESPGMVTGVTDRIESMLIEQLEAADTQEAARDQNDQNAGGSVAGFELDASVPRGHSPQAPPPPLARNASTPPVVRLVSSSNEDGFQRLVDEDQLQPEPEWSQRFSDWGQRCCAKAPSRLRIEVPPLLAASPLLLVAFVDVGAASTNELHARHELLLTLGTANPHPQPQPQP